MTRKLLTSVPVEATPTWFRWMPGTAPHAKTPLTIHILESGWLRVHWDDKTISYVSPAHVLEIGGAAVIVSDD